MPAPLNQLLQKLRKGDGMVGTYHRRSIEDESTIRFDSLVVKTANGSDYVTTDPEESELFFALTEMRGTGVNSGREDNCRYYESIGYWLKAAQKS